MKKTLLLSTGIVVIAILLLLPSCGPNLSEFQYLKEPQISTRPTQKMIVVELKGDPNVTSPEAIPILYKTFFRLKKEVKGMEMAPPRARWLSPFDTPKSEWVGLFGLPVPESVNTLPEKKKESEPDVRIENWEYGEVAEILHIGPYDKEMQTIEKLHNFIQENGYKIAGPHEEEYLKGPGMFSKGNPEKYQTIIRYRIEKE